MPDVWERLKNKYATVNPDILYNAGISQSQDNSFLGAFNINSSIENTRNIIEGDEPTKRLIGISEISRLSKEGRFVKPRLHETELDEFGVPKPRTRIADPFTRGFISGFLPMGITEGYTKPIEYEQEPVLTNTGNEIIDTALEVAGGLTGIAIPFGIAGKIVGSSKLIQKIANPFLKRMITGSLTFPLAMSPESIIGVLTGERTLPETGLKISEEALFGGAFGILPRGSITKNTLGTIGAAALGYSMGALQTGDIEPTKENLINAGALALLHGIGVINPKNKIYDKQFDPKENPNVKSALTEVLKPEEIKKPIETKVAPEEIKGKEEITSEVKIEKPVKVEEKIIEPNFDEMSNEQISKFVDDLPLREADGTIPEVNRIAKNLLKNQPIEVVKQAIKNIQKDESSINLQNLQIYADALNPVVSKEMKSLQQMIKKKIVEPTPKVEKPKSVSTPVSLTPELTPKVEKPVVEENIEYLVGKSGRYFVPESGQKIIEGDKSYQFIDSNNKIVKSIPKDKVQIVGRDKTVADAFKEAESPKVEKPIEKITPVKDFAERWDGAKLGKRIEWLKRGRWITNKNQLSKLGERIAESKWKDISDVAKVTLEREIGKDYPDLQKVEKPVEGVAPTNEAAIKRMLTEGKQPKDIAEALNVKLSEVERIKEAEQLSKKELPPTENETILRLRKEAQDELGNLTSTGILNPQNYINSIKWGTKLLKDGLNNFGDWSKKMLSDLGNRVKPMLLKIWSTIKKETKSLAEIGVDKIGAFWESKFNPARPIHLSEGTARFFGKKRPDEFKSRFEGVKQVAETTKEIDKNNLEIPDERLRDIAVRRFIDKMGRARKIIQKVGEVPDEINFYLQAEAFVQRAKDKIDKIYDVILNKKDGLLKRLTDKDFSIIDLGKYLLAKHAPERNKYIRENVNPKVKYGSGITDKEAIKIQKEYEGSGIEEFAEEFRKKIIKPTLYTLYKSGIINEARYELLKNQYQWYVPLKGTKELMKIIGQGKGFSVESTGIIKAKGRKTISENPFVQMMLDAGNTVIRAEKNKVMRSFYDFIDQYPSDKWSVSGRRKLQGVKKNQVGVYVDGKAKLITVRDEALLKGLKNLGVERGFTLVNKFNSYLRSVVTYYNPEFILTNFERDLQTALINIAGEKSIELARKVAKDIPKVMKDIWRGQRGKETIWYGEYKELGGKMSWLEYKSVDQVANEFGKKVKSYQGRSKFKDAVIETEKFISDMNDVVENAFRVSSYKNLVERGVSKEQAISFAKNLTVNFNAKGEYGQFLNSLYLFWNAGMQGSVRIIRALRHPRTRKIAAGLIGMSAMQNYMNRMIDEESYKNIPDWVRDNNWIFMLPNGKHLKIRMPYGYNVFNVIGNTMVDHFLDKEDIATTGGRILNAAVDAFNPFGQSGSVGQFFSPTFLDPIIQVAENKKFTGAPIGKEQPAYQPKKPSSQLYFESVRKPTKEFTTWLNDITGGSEIESGIIDVNPENVDFLIDFLGGGVGKFINNAFTTGESLLSEGDFPDVLNVPIARQFLGEKTESSIISKVYELWEESGRTKFSKEKRNEFIKSLSEAVKEGNLVPENAKRLLNTFLKGQLNLQFQP